MNETKRHLRPERYALATAWVQALRAPTPPSSHLLDTLADALAQVGFTDDHLAGLVQAAGSLPAATTTVDWPAYFARVPDAQVLGDAIVAQRHTLAADAVAAPAHKPWFVAAFARLAELTAPLGPLARVTLTSTAAAPLLPNPGHVETAQRLTVTATGEITLWHEFADHTQTEDTQTVAPTALPPLLTQVLPVAEALSTLNIPDVGQWHLTAVDHTGRKESFTGPLYATEDDTLSDPLRAVLKLPHLWLFDQDPDKLERLTVVFAPHDQHRETLVFARQQATLRVSDHQGQDTFDLTIHAATIPALLDALGYALGETTPKSLPQTADSVAVTLRYRYRPPFAITGTLNAAAPIPGWDTAMDAIDEFLAAHEPALLTGGPHRLYAPKPGLLLYAAVVLHHGGRAYSYLATRAFKVGERVKIPLNQTTAYGTIVALNYYLPDEAPYPPALTKTIIGKADPIEEALGE